MKSEHRHELKTNDLAKGILTAGDYVRVYGGRVALGVAIVILVIVLIMQQAARSRQAETLLPAQLAQARAQIEQLQQTQLTPNDRQITDDARNAIKAVKDNASNDALKAEAFATEGDLNWAIANYPKLTPTSTTAPVPVTDAQRTEAASAAKAAYQQVLDKYPTQTLAVLTARFGLAALAENARDWATARQQYEAVKAIEAAPKVYKQLAEGRIQYLELIQKPVLIGQVPEKPLPPPLDPADMGLDESGLPRKSSTSKPATTATSTTGQSTTHPATTAPKAGATTKPSK